MDCVVVNSQTTSVGPANRDYGDRESDSLHQPREECAIENLVFPRCGSEAFLNVVESVQPKVIVWAVQNAYPSPQVVNDVAERSMLEDCYSGDVSGDLAVFI